MPWSKRATDSATQLGALSPSPSAPALPAASSISAANIRSRRTAAADCSSDSQVKLTTWR